MDSLNDISRNYTGNIEELRGRKDTEAVKIVAREMESLFTHEMIKAMRETTDTSPKNDLGGSTYTSMFDMELAKLFSQRGLGLQDMLLKGLNRIAGESGKQDKGTPDSNGNVSSAGASLFPENNCTLLPATLDTPLSAVMSVPVARGEADTENSTKD